MNDDKLTILGPEPTAPEERSPQKRVNIEALLLMAKYDEGFKERLFEDRDKALTESGIDFTPGEKLLLTNISDQQLEENIKEFRVPGVTKKSLSNWAKAAAVILLLSSLTLACTERNVGRTLDSSPDDRRSVCGSLMVRPFSPDDDQSYTSIKKIAILPFYNHTKKKDAEKLIAALFTLAIARKVMFESVEDVRYVASVMKQMKIKRTEALDKDLVLKLGETMRCEAIVVGEVDTYTIGKRGELIVISVRATMLDTRSGDILWTDSDTHSSINSVPRIFTFGATPGPNYVGMTESVVEKLVDSMASWIEKAREEEARMEEDKRD